MIKQFRPIASSKEKKQLKKSMLQEIHQSVKENSDMLSLTAQAKLQFDNFTRPQLNEQPVEESPLSYLTVNPIGKQTSHADILDPFATSESNEEKLPDLQFFNPPDDLHQRRALQVRFDTSNEQSFPNRERERMLREYAQLEDERDGFQTQNHILNDNLKNQEASMNQRISALSEALQQAKQEVHSLMGQHSAIVKEHEVAQLSCQDLRVRLVKAETELANVQSYGTDISKAQSKMAQHLKEQSILLDQRLEEIMELKQQSNQHQLQNGTDQNTIKNQRHLIEKGQQRIHVLQTKLKESESQQILLSNQCTLLEEKLKELVQTRTHFQEPQSIPSNPDVNKIKELYDAQNQCVRLRQKQIQNEEEIRQLKLQVQLFVQKENIHNDIHCENSRLKDEIMMLEKEIEQGKRKNREELEQVCRQRDFNEERERYLNQMEDDMKLKQFNVLQEVKNVETFKQTIAGLKEIIEKREQCIANLEGKYQQEISKVQQSLALAKDRLETEKIRGYHLDPNTMRSPFSVPPLNQKYERQYL